MNRPEHPSVLRTRLTKTPTPWAGRIHDPHPTVTLAAPILLPAPVRRGSVQGHAVHQRAAARLSCHTSRHAGIYRISANWH
jgi:hypothetical protein